MGARSKYLKHFVKDLIRSDKFEDTTYRYELVDILRYHGLMVGVYSEAINKAYDTGYRDGKEHGKN